MKFRLIFLYTTFIVVYGLIFLAIGLAPWFSWKKNALSDLGNCMRSNVSVIFNLALVSGGWLLAMYSIVYLRTDTKISWLFFIASGFALQLIGTYDEAYHYIHWMVSVTFFLVYDISLLVYSLERRILIGILLFIVYIGVWYAFYNGLLSGGVSIPEMITSLIVSSMLVIEETRRVIRAVKASSFPKQG